MGIFVQMTKHNIEKEFELNHGVKTRACIRFTLLFQLTQKRFLPTAPAPHTLKSSIK